MSEPLKERKKLVCPHEDCESVDFQGEVTQNVDVELFEDGWIDNGFNFSDPALNKDLFWCSNCGRGIMPDYQIGGGLKLRIQK